MKYVMIIFICLLFLGCGNFKRMEAGWKGYAEITVDGVVYLQFPSGVTPKYNTDGKIVTIK